ncbi:MAG: DUF512 domain-containing protein [Chloroflexi bacterium]|nr:DUF512 domain-containing protein [Chloroflexota bacterium]
MTNSETSYLRITAVQPGSAAAAAGLRPGDALVSLAGQPVRDVIDYHYLAAESDWRLEIKRDGSTIPLEASVPIGEELGVEFAAVTPDGIRRCNNRCPFCFVTQSPKGMRKTIYIKDDDIRYSFLHAHFVTMSNWTEEDWRRIEEQRLSPLYISVHATDPAVRRRLLGNKHAPDVLEQIRRLAALRIAVHTQIVVCPEINDGAQMLKTIEDLHSLYPTVLTISLVPVGLTQFRSPRDGVRVPTLAELRDLVEAARPLQRRFRRELGVDYLYVSDEAYLRTGLPLPPAARYDGYPQYENGIGMARTLLNNWKRDAKSLPAALSRPRKLTLISGELPAPLLAALAADLERIDGLTVELVPVVNRFFGGSVSASGLLTGRDILEQTSNRELGDLVLLPRRMFDDKLERAIDDVTFGEVVSQLRRPCVAVESAGDVSRIVRGLAKGTDGRPDPASPLTLGAPSFPLVAV